MTHDAFKNPEQIYRGTDFWMLNDALPDDEICAQIREMKDKGVYSFIARTYLGLKSDYPGPAFKKKMRLIVDTAKECGLKVFLQAGYMPEAVLELPESCALRYIYSVAEGGEEGRRVLCRHDGYSFVEHNSLTFLDMFDAEAMDYYLMMSYEKMWESLSDEYGKTILSVWVDEPSYNGSFLPWTPKLESQFFERWGYPLADKVWQLYIDSESCAAVRYHYRTIMRDLLEENYFKRVRRWCNDHNLLFSGHLMGEETCTSQLYRAAAAMPYYRYFDIPGIDVLTAAMNWVDDPIQPQGDINARQTTLYNTAMQCVSASHQAGKKHILAEMYGVVSENMTFRNQMNMFDSYAAMGINHRCVHGMFFSLHGRGKRAYPPHIGYQQPFWKKYKNITDYCARVSAFISDGRAASDIAVIHPLETAFTLFRGSLEHRQDGGDAARQYDAVLYNLLDMLKTAHRDVDLCDLASLRDMGSVKGGRLHVGEMSYGTVILPDLAVITQNLLELLTQLSAAGGRVIILGSMPNMLDGYTDETLAKQLKALPGVLFADDLCTLGDLLSGDNPQFTVTGMGSQNVLVNHRVCDDGDKYLLYNKNHAHSARVTLRAHCADGSGAYLYSAQDAAVSAYPADVRDGMLTMEIFIPAGGSVLLSVEPAHACDRNAVLDAPEIVLPITGGWELQPDGDNALMLEYCRFRRGNGEFSRKLPIIAVQRLLSDEEYNGEITLQYTIQNADLLESLSLAVEDPERQCITLDGRVIDSAPVGYYCDKTFQVLPIPDSLPAGVHTLEIVREFHPLSKVTNALTQLFETRYGTELEPLYLLGKFGVYGQPVSSLNGCMTFARDFTLAKPISGVSCGELASEGYPFYAGEMTLARDIDVPAAYEKRAVKLRIGVLNAGAGEIYLNGLHVGDINRAPCDIDCTSAWKSGRNRLEIRLYSTLRNIIGPFHRPRGEVGNLFGGGYKNPDAAWLSVDTTAPGWENRMTASSTWTDNYNVVPFGIADAAIVFPE